MKLKWVFNCSAEIKRRLGYPLFSPFSVIRQTQKKAVTISKNRHFNLKLRQTDQHAVLVVHLSLPFMVKFNRNINISSPYFHCVDFETSSCRFQAPEILCRGTGPPSSSLVHFLAVFSFLFRPKIIETHSTVNEKKKGDGLAISHSC